MSTPELPDLATASVAELTAALVALQREYATPSHVVGEHEAPGHVPPDVATWWRAAYRRRIDLIRAEPRGPLYVGTVAEPMPLRRARLRKPPAPPAPGR